MGVNDIQSKITKNTLLLAGVAFLSGCNHYSGQYAYSAPMHGTIQNQQAPFQAMSPALQSPTNNLSTQADLSRAYASIDQLNDRVERTERALIRIDRRLQLIESKELGRMMGQSSDGQTDAQPSFYPTQQAPLSQKPLFQPVSNAPLSAMPNQRTLPMHSQNGFMGLNSVLQNNQSPQGSQRNGRFMPVTSSLQAAPQQLPRMMPASQAPSQQNLNGAGTFKRMPSLADAAPTSLGVADKTDVRIWTVAFEPAKVWPGRDQLASSRNLVEKLKLNQPIALYARGNNPNSKEFRERVRALSRYLSKVSDRSDISISTLSAPHLSSETIEIFATR